MPIVEAVVAGAMLSLEERERCFSKLKQFRAVATRYDKRERIYQGTIDVGSISIWLRDPSHDPRDTS
jgi:transposase